MPQLHSQIFKIKNDEDFEKHALDVYHYQVETNVVYKEYVTRLFGNKKVEKLDDIPFLPISFFKTHRVVCGEFDTERVFTSSGTTAKMSSHHHIASLAHYQMVFQKIFKSTYAAPNKYCIIGLLPSYLERKGSSLVFMVKNLIALSKHPSSGFYLHNHSDLKTTLKQLEKSEQPTILFGVTYALLDFFAQYPMKLEYCTLIETGGMKGRKKEMTRNEVHCRLKKNTGLQNIHAEYGMTELLSQAYSKGSGIYKCPPWLKVSTRKTTDPFAPEKIGKTGGLNIIDLANIDSCAFIATEDLGKIHQDGSFEVLGRFDHSDVRGCSLMVY